MRVGQVFFFFKLIPVGCKQIFFLCFQVRFCPAKADSYVIGVRASDFYFTI